MFQDLKLQPDYKMALWGARISAGGDRGILTLT